METNFNLREALKETRKRYSLEEKAIIILQIIIAKMKEQDIDTDAVATMEIKCKLNAPIHCLEVPQLYYIIANVTYISGGKKEIYKTNLILNNPYDKKVLMDAIVMQVQACNFRYNVFNDFKGEIRLRIRL